MKEAYPSRDIAAALGTSERAVQIRAKKEGWAYLEERVKGGTRKLYIYASLPKDVQKALVTWDLKAVVSQTPSATPLAKVGELVEATPAGKPIPLAQWQERKALAKADLLRLYLEAAWQVKGWGRVLPAKLAFLEEYNQGLAGPYPILHKILGPLTYKTVERWAVEAKKAQQAGSDLVEALAPKYGDHKRGVRGVSKEQAAILLAWAMNPNKHNLAEVIRQARESMLIRGVPDRQSEATYRRFLEDWRDHHINEWTYEREGKQAWNDKCAYYLKRDYDRLAVGDCLVADGHTLNFNSINPYTGKPKRLTLITFMDMKSNFPVGWEIMPTESTRSIAAALRRAVLTLGKLPLCLYLDNGRAFGAKHFTGDLKQSGIEGLFRRLGIETIFAWPYHGQSKTVERWHKTLKEFEKQMPTYTGGNIDEKPPHLHRGEQEHRKMWAKLTGGAVPTLMETHLALAAWLDERYNPRPQPRGHLKGKSPLEVFEAGMGPGMDAEELRFLMLSQTVRTIHRRGITFNGQDYYHPALAGRRHPVLIRYDLLDPDAILVFEEDGNLLCEARVMPEVHPIARITGTVEDRAEVAAQIGIKKAQEKQASSICRMITHTLVQPETEAHFARLGLNTEGAPAPRKLSAPAPLSEAEKQQIEADAALASRKMQAERDRLEELKARPDCQRYLELLQIKASGGEPTADDRLFMRYFRAGDEYAALKDWFAAQDLEMVCQAGKKPIEDSNENRV